MNRVTRLSDRYVAVIEQIRPPGMPPVWAGEVRTVDDVPVEGHVAVGPTAEAVLDVLRRQ